MPQNFSFQITILFLLLIASFGIYQEMKIMQRPEAQPHRKPDCGLVLLHLGEGGDWVWEVVNLRTEARQPLTSFFETSCHFYPELTE